MMDLILRERGRERRVKSQPKKMEEEDMEFNFGGFNDEFVLQGLKNSIPVEEGGLNALALGHTVGPMDAMPTAQDEPCTVGHLYLNCEWKKLKEINIEQVSKNESKYQLWLQFTQPFLLFVSPDVQFLEILAKMIIEHHDQQLERQGVPYQEIPTRHDLKVEWSSHWLQGLTQVPPNQGSTHQYCRTRPKIPKGSSVLP